VWLGRLRIGAVPQLMVSLALNYLKVESRTYPKV